MARLTQRDWLMAGVAVLGEQGAAALTVERLTAALGVTKGSFYHHFGGMGDYKAGLLELFEAESTRNVMSLSEQLATPVEKLAWLLRAAGGHPPALERAFRAWAMDDADVGVVQARIDGQRIAYLRGLCAGLGIAPAQAETLSHMAYTILVGSQQLHPPLGRAAVLDMYALFQAWCLRLAAEEGGAGARSGDSI